MYHRGRKKMRYLIIGAVILLSCQSYALPKSIAATKKPDTHILTDDNFDNNIIDFEEDYNVKFNKKYGKVPWNPNEYFNKESNRYTIVKDVDKDNEKYSNHVKNETEAKILDEETTTVDFSVIPLELTSTTENTLLSILESTMEPDLTVIPLSKTKETINVDIEQAVTLPASSTQEPESTTEHLEIEKIEIIITTEKGSSVNIFVPKRYTKAIESETTTVLDVETTTDITDFERNVNITSLHLTNITEATTEIITYDTNYNLTDNHEDIEHLNASVTTENYQDDNIFFHNSTRRVNLNNETINSNISQTYSNETIDVLNLNIAREHSNDTRRVDLSNETINLNNSQTYSNETIDVLNLNITRENINRSDSNSPLEDPDVPIFTELDTEDVSDIPEDYYDTKDIVPTTAPKSDALSVIFGLAGSVVESVVESVAERVVPKGIFDLFKRMQRQNEALEVEKLRSREENGGLGQFTRGILKSITSGIGKPLSQLMAGVRDIGSLDSDRGFINSLASGVTSVANVANSVVDSFKDRVQAIYPGTVWCGDGRSATARSSDLGLFFFTDTCCRQHDACKLYIRAGETKYGLTNTGLFTRSHCSCDAKFRECLRRTNSLVSAQIGLTYFNVLGPQCFRRAHPIVKCVRKTRITGQKCEEYELDYTKPRMWQWFDNETF